MNHEIRAITLRNFRSYKEASFEFDSGVNIVIGPNAAGKTNLLEAVYAISLGKGFRTKSDADLIRKGSEWARLESTYENIERIIKLQKTPGQRLKKQFQLGGRTVSRLTYQDMLPVVLFHPDDMRLTNGSPERRRDFIDNLLSQTTPSYRQDLNAYERALKQRNTVLKNNGNTNQLFVWNIQLAERGGRIHEQRHKLIKTINEDIGLIYSNIAGSNHVVTASYETGTASSNYSDWLLRRLENSNYEDFSKGYTTFGPHRDDIVFSINEVSFKQVASRGENRTLMLALKIFELKQIEAVRNQKPLLLLDDVFSELDGSRRKLLTTYLDNHQTIITTTDADILEKYYVSHTRLISL